MYKSDNHNPIIFCYSLPLSLVRTEDINYTGDFNGYTNQHNQNYMFS